MHTTKPTDASPALTSHRQRWLTAAVLGPAVILLIAYASATVFLYFITAVALLGMYEYGEITLGKNAIGEKLVLFLACPVVIWAFSEEHFAVILSFLVGATIVSFSLSLFREQVKEAVFNRPMATVFGIVYIPLLLVHIVGLRDFGIGWVFFVIIFPVAGDVAAFYVGKTWGKRKLLPSVSPNKTVAGFLAIPLGALIGGGIFAHFFLSEVAFYHIAIITIGGSMLGQIGDLCESMLKRAAGVKDSGRILPGHGGILDRIDCLLFVFPLVYYYKVFIVG
ncbi:MAG: phosphatidate cytidylyltransferase [Deltaproteobacteria bacterium]|nr:phosphatidate cytidylyltransferase [Deltaproteobacteria bacterium]